ncbi:MAG: adenylyltransferase/cytidyltransferase family protein [Planctomycetes bacterium]|nr:adenylyltransferase/cytidyltransferase family protein [Planctomycetota bacterium]
MTASYEKKIVSLKDLVAAAEHARAAGKTIVQCHGCFDIVHPGHIRYLEFARQQGDVLIVTLTGDANVDKGVQRPYIPQELRAENLAALMFVDYVHVTEEATAQRVLSEVRPDVYVKGREYEYSRDPGFLAEKNVVEGYGGRIIFSSGEIVFSSTALVEQLPRTPETESHRLNLLCRRYGITAASLDQTLNRFHNLHVIVVGDIVVDRYVLCDTLGVASESPILSLAHRDERTFVGGAAIVARHVAALGGHAFLLSAGAADAQTDLVSEVLETEGVDVHLIRSRPALVEKTRFLADDTKLFKVDRARCLPLDSVAERRAALILEQQSKLADAVIFCDFGYGMITAGLLRRVLPSLRQNVRLITADVSGGRANLLNFQNVDLLCPTELEARAMLNDFDSGLSAVAWELLGKTQARHLFITLEKRGMVVFERASQQRGTAEWSGRLRSEALPSFATHAVDRLGCGDALLAASTLSLAAGAPLLAAAYLGNAAAALEISVLGNHPIEEPCLRGWLQGRREFAASEAMREPAGSRS